MRLIFHPSQTLTCVGNRYTQDPQNHQGRQPSSRTGYQPPRKYSQRKGSLQRLRSQSTGKLNESLLCGDLGSWGPLLRT